MYNWEREREREWERQREKNRERVRGRVRIIIPNLGITLFPRVYKILKWAQLSRSLALLLSHSHTHTQHMHNMCWHNIHKLAAYRTHTIPKKKHTNFEYIFRNYILHVQKLIQLKNKPRERGKERESAREGDEQAKNAKRAATIINMLPKGSCSKWN